MRTIKVRQATSPVTIVIAVVLGFAVLLTVLLAITS